MGRYDGAEVKQCAAAGVTTYIPKAITSVNKKRGLFTKEDFTYDVGAEMSLKVLSYNIKRVVNIIGVERMIAAVT